MKNILAQMLFEIIDAKDKLELEQGLEYRSPKHE
jgi:hypothetical protein